MTSEAFPSNGAAAAPYLSHNEFDIFIIKLNGVFLAAAEIGGGGGGGGAGGGLDIRLSILDECT